MLSDAKRHELYVALTGALGESAAASLMAALPPVPWDELARRSDLTLLEARLTADTAHLRTEVRTDIADLRTEVRTDIADLRCDLDTRMATLTGKVESDIAGLRSQLDRQLVRFMVANVPVVLGVAGLVLAATRLG